MQYIVLDLETNGLPKDGVYPSIVEIGAIVYDDDHVVDQYATLVRLPDGEAINQEAQRVNKITQSDLDLEGISLCDALDGLAAFAARSDAYTFVGHNIITYDLAVHAAASEKTGEPYSLILDTLTANIDDTYDTRLILKAHILGLTRGRYEARGFFYGRVEADRARVRTSLSHVRRLVMGMMGEQSHRALADCIETAILFQTLRKRGIIEAVLGEAID